MFTRFWLFVLSAVGLTVALVSGVWLWALVLYLLTGVLWVWHDSSRPPPYGRGCYLGGGLPFKAALLWPLIAFAAAVESREALRDPKRFLVLGPGSGFSAAQWFPRWDEAVSHGKKVAAELGEKVTISDAARWQWKSDPFDRTASWKRVRHEVSPSGAVERFTFPSLVRRLSWNLTHEQLMRACLLRAVEWELWPLFLSQSILPILYLMIPWKLASLLVCSLTVVFLLFRYRLASLLVAVIGQNIVRLTRWPALLGITCYFFWKGSVSLGALTLATVPIVTVVFWLMGLLTPSSGTVRLQRMFLVQAGYDSDANGK